MSDGLITVKKVLNIRGNVDFSTGNVEFYNNMVVHGSVRSGFELDARNIHVQGVVEQAQMVAKESILCSGGIKGSKGALLKAADSIRVKFCEFATLHAGKNIIVDGASLHSKLYARNGIIMKGRFTGGRAVCYHYLLIEGKVGGGLNADTEVILGYDPALIFKDFRLSRRLKKLRDHIGYLKAELAVDNIGSKTPQLEEELEEFRILLAKNLHARHVLTEKIMATEDLTKCKFLAPGKVEPGVEISIGPAWYKVMDPLENVRFYFEDNEVKYTSPAITE
ncbi:MAG: FapA family protein [Desulfovibrio sp.]